MESAKGPAATWSLGFTVFQHLASGLRFNTFLEIREYALRACSTIRTDRHSIRLDRFPPLESIACTLSVTLKPCVMIKLYRNPNSLRDGSRRAWYGAAPLGKKRRGKRFQSFAGMCWSGIRGTPSSGSRSLILRTENWELKTNYQLIESLQRQISSLQSRPMVVNPLQEFPASPLHP
jgi:hypothetical protein